MIGRGVGCSHTASVAAINFYSGLYRVGDELLVRRQGCLEAGQIYWISAFPCLLAAGEPGRPIGKRDLLPAGQPIYRRKR